MTRDTRNGTQCPRCGAAASGAFCSECGASLKGNPCVQCGTTLSPGARFCHRCGTPANSTTALPSPTARRSTDPLPWAVAAIALVALIALVVGQRLGGNPTSSEDAQTADAGAPAMPRGPNLSGMTPQEITDALYNRVMQLHEAGKKDSVEFIALNMAIPAFQMHDSLNTDLRYDLGRIAEVSGVLDLAKAQADTILRQHPQHLLGLLLAANVSRQMGDSAAARDYDRRLLAAEKGELASGREEYARHEKEITRALENARRGGTSAR